MGSTHPSSYMLSPEALLKILGASSSHPNKSKAYPEETTTVFFKAIRYKCLPSSQSMLPKGRYHLLSSRELVLINTNINEDINSSVINVLLSFSCFTVIAQRHFLNPKGNTR